MRGLVGEQNGKVRAAVSNLRLFIDVDGEQVAAVDALAIPHIGDQIWVKTIDWQGTVKVESVEHQFDRTRPDRYGTQDVELNCKLVERKQGWAMAEDTEVLDTMDAYVYDIGKRTPLPKFRWFIRDKLTINPATGDKTIYGHRKVLQQAIRLPGAVHVIEWEDIPTLSDDD